MRQQAPDKAVKPSSVMGMTKDLAERYVVSLSAASNTKFVVVRFGNVLQLLGWMDCCLDSWTPEHG